MSTEARKHAAKAARRTEGNVPEIYDQDAECRYGDACLLHGAARAVAAEGHADRVIVGDRVWTPDVGWHTLGEWTPAPYYRASRYDDDALAAPRGIAVAVAASVLLLGGIVLAFLLV